MEKKTIGAQPFTRPPFKLFQGKIFPGEKDQASSLESNQKVRSLNTAHGLMLTLALFFVFWML